MHAVGGVMLLIPVFSGTRPIRVHAAVMRWDVGSAFFFFYYYFFSFWRNINVNVAVDG
jgi:hypothetical protein